MKFTIQIIVTFLLCWVAQIFLPWWTMALISFVVGYMVANSGFQSFLAGFLAVGLLWFSVALYLDVTTQSILSQKVGSLFPSIAGGRISPRVNIFFLTVIIGGMVGGMASLTGALISYKPKRRW